jgi:hypothetical protein
MDNREKYGRFKGLLFWVLVLMQIPFEGNAQEGLSGRVIDIASGQPVAGAAVFINNSTYATACDEKGTFNLQKLPQPPFELIITAVGYKTGALKIDQAPSSDLLVKLQQKTVDLGEVTVMSAEKDGWAKYGKLFTEEFIGYSPFAADCIILNKEVLQFRYDAGNNVLKVWAEKPLQIRNKAMGYLITYQLEDFEKNFNTRKLYYQGYTQYTSLETRKEKEKKKWAANRQHAYNGSLAHFFRSMYKGTIEQDGFEIRTMKRIEGKDYGRYVPVWTDTISFTNSARVAGLLREIYKDTSDKQSMIGALTTLLRWKNGQDTGGIRIAAPAELPGEQPSREFLFVRNKADQEKMIVSYFDLNRLSPEDSIKASHLVSMKIDGKPMKLPAVKSVCDIVYRPLLQADKFISDRNAATLLSRFPDYLQITYTLEPEDAAYAYKRSLAARAPAPNQVSIISLTDEEGITVMPNGNFSPPYRLFVEQYWSYEKLDKMLPLDYEP